MYPEYTFIFPTFVLVCLKIIAIVILYLSFVVQFFFPFLFSFLSKNVTVEDSPYRMSVEEAAGILNHVSLSWFNLCLPYVKRKIKFCEHGTKKNQMNSSTGIQNHDLITFVKLATCLLYLHSYYDSR